MSTKTILQFSVISSLPLSAFKIFTLPLTSPEKFRTLTSRYNNRAKTLHTLGFLDTATYLKTNKAAKLAHSSPDALTLPCFIL